MKNVPKFAALSALVTVIVISILYLQSGTPKNKPKAKATGSTETPPKINRLEPGSVPSPIVQDQPKETSHESDISADAGDVMSRAFALAKSDPAKALDLIDESFPPEIVLQKKTELAIRLAGEDPAGMSALLGCITDPALRSSVVAAVAGDWTKRDPNRMLAFAEGSLKASDKATAYQSIADALAKASDFQNAAMVVGLLQPGSTLKQGAIADILKPWMAADLNGAAQWIQTLSPKEQESTVNMFLVSMRMNSLVSGADARNIEPVLKLVESVGNPELRRQGISQAMQILVGSGSISEAKTWIGQLPPEYRAAAQAQFIASNQKGAVSELTPMALAITDPASRAMAIGELTSRVFDQNSAASTTWVVQLPGKDREIAVKQLASKWYAQDPQAAHRWIQSLPDRVLRDQALQQYIAAAKRNSDTAGAEMASKELGK